MSRQLCNPFYLLLALGVIGLVIVLGLPWFPFEPKSPIASENDPTIPASPRGSFVETRRAIEGVGGFSAQQEPFLKAVSASTGSPAADVEVYAFDSAYQTIAVGRTDENGCWMWPTHVNERPDTEIILFKERHRVVHKKAQSLRGTTVRIRECASIECVIHGFPEDGASSYEIRFLMTYPRSRAAIYTLRKNNGLFGSRIPSVISSTATRCQLSRYFSDEVIITVEIRTTDTDRVVARKTVKSKPNPSDADEHIVVRFEKGQIPSAYSDLALEVEAPNCYGSMFEFQLAGPQFGKRTVRNSTARAVFRGTTGIAVRERFRDLPHGTYIPVLVFDDALGGNMTVRLPALHVIGQREARVVVDAIPVAFQLSGNSLAEHALLQVSDKDRLSSWQKKLVAGGDPITTQLPKGRYWARAESVAGKAVSPIVWFDVGSIRTLELRLLPATVVKFLVDPKFITQRQIQRVDLSVIDHDRDNKLPVLPFTPQRALWNFASGRYTVTAEFDDGTKVVHSFHAIGSTELLVKLL